MNLPVITIDDRPRPHKIAHYTLDLLPYTISIVSENSVSTLNTTSDLPQLILLTSDDTNPTHEMNKYEPAVAVWKEDTGIENTMKKYTKKNDVILLPMLW